VTATRRLADTRRSRKGSNSPRRLAQPWIVHPQGPFQQLPPNPRYGWMLTAWARPPWVKPQKRPIIHARSLFQELHAEQRIGHRGCRERVPFRAMGSPPGREGAASGVHPPLAAPSTRPALSPSHYWPEGARGSIRH
jgi:hypothetical protein